ncbi:MAG: META domain-containing protein [Acidobacteriota bacterium]
MKPTNDAAADALERALKSKKEVVITGYHCHGVEYCLRFDCYHVSDAEAFSAGEALAACSDGGRLAATVWQLKAFISGDAEEPPIEDTVIIILFSSVAVSGRGGCNIYGADYLVKPPNQISITNLLSTQMHCDTPQGVMGQEKRYFEILGEVDHFVQTTDSLVLTSTVTKRGVRFEELRGSESSD